MKCKCKNAPSNLKNKRFRRKKRDNWINACNKALHKEYFFAVVTEFGEI